MQERNYEKIAKELMYLLRNYEGLTKQIVQITLRAQSYGMDPDKETLLNGAKYANGKTRFQGLEQLKEREKRKLKKAVASWPIWEEWLSRVPGIGETIAAKLIRLYYFKLVPICKDCNADLGDDFFCIKCGKKAKGQGNLEHRVELREFPSISSWWHFMGRHVENGRMPRRQKGEFNVTWSATGRNVGYDIRESFNKKTTTHLYRAYAEKRKRYREGTHPNATKGHRHNMAWNETIKLFLSHFWQVARTIDGQPLTEPWSMAHGGHDTKDLIPPFYWD